MFAKIREKFFSKDEERTRRVVKYVMEFCIGFLLAGLSVSGSFAPFGVAFCSVGGFPSLLGALLGHMVTQTDVLRYATACCISYFARQILSPVSDAPDEIQRFLFTVWAFLASGLIGAVFGKYTFADNALYALSGVVSGFFAYIFSVFEKCLHKESKLSTKLGFIAFSVSSAVLLASAVSRGPMYEYTALAVTVFILCSLIRRCGMLYVTSYAMMLSFGLCLYSIEYTYAAGILLAGTVIGSLLLPLGKACFGAAFPAVTIAVGIITGGSFSVLYVVGAVCAGGLIFFLLPDKTGDKLFRFFIPEIKGKVTVKRRGNMSETGRRRLRDSERYDAVREVCVRCPDKLLCWVKNYDASEKIFSSLSVGKSDAEHELCSFCREPKKITDVFRRGKIEDDGLGFGIDFARASVSKGGETVCGDTSGGFVTGDGKYVLCIADGMGSGHSAARQSENAERLMENMLKSGVSREDALDFLNRSVYSGGDEKILGLDLAVIDLLDGSCDMYKADAAPTFVVRRGNVYAVGSASMPMGIAAGYEVRKNSCKLLDGDWVIMFSDGLCCDGSKKAAETVSDIFRSGAPACIDVAEKLISELGIQKKAPEDDVTVIAAKITRVGY